MSDQRNVSRPGRGQEPRTPPTSGQARSLEICIDGDFVTVDQKGLHGFFKRRQNDQTQARLRKAAVLKWVRCERRADRRARRRLEKEMREWDRAGNRRVRVRAAQLDAESRELERQRQRQKQRKAAITRITRPPRPLPRYRFAIVDKAGRRGVFVHFYYDSAGTNRFGVAERRVRYMFKLDHAELIDGEVPFRSNMGEGLSEIVEAVNVIETANRSARKNAKVGTNAIYQFAADCDEAGRGRAIDLLAAKYEALGLAYVMVPHMPSPGSDQRNFHVHVWYTTRPMERVAPYEWNIGEQLRTDCDSPEALYDLRRTWADICTKVSHERGQRFRYTHLGNVERGLANRPLKGLNPRQVKNWRDGKYEAAVAAMQATIADNEELIAEIEQRSDEAALEIVRQGVTKINRLEVAAEGSGSPPDRHSERRAPLPRQSATDAPTRIAATPKMPPTKRVAPTPVAGHPVALSVPPGREKTPHLHPPLATRSNPSTVPTQSEETTVKLTPPRPSKAHPLLSPAPPTASPLSLAGSTGGTPRSLTPPPKRLKPAIVTPTATDGGARLFPVSSPRPIPLSTARSMPSHPGLTPVPRRLAPRALKSTNCVSAASLEPVSAPNSSRLTPTSPEPFPPVPRKTTNQTIPTLRAIACSPRPELSQVDAPKITTLSATATDPARAQRDVFSHALRLDRLSLGLAMQDLRLAMVGERLAHNRAATGEEHALLDQAGLEVFAVDPTAAERARRTIGRFVALYIEREDRPDPLAGTSASSIPGVHPVGSQMPDGEREAESGSPFARPVEGKRSVPPITTADTAGGGPGLAISPVTQSHPENSADDDKQGPADWRDVDRQLDPLKRIEWLFERLRRHGRKRLVRLRGNELTLPRDLLTGLQLTESDLANDPVQAWLRSEHEQQVDALSPMVDQLASRPDLMVRSNRRWFVLSGLDREIVDELSQWRDEPLVQSALDNFAGLDPVSIDSEEWQRRLIAFLDTAYPEEQMAPAPVDDASGAADAEKQNARSDFGREERDQGRSDSGKPQDKKYRGPPPGEEGIGR